MIDRLYDKYFQKSRSFLYPALGIRRDSLFMPVGTYISIEGIIKPTDMRLICEFQREPGTTFSDFEHMYLLSHSLYMRTMETVDHNLYIFDYTIYKKDWYHFLYAKYSLFSPMFRKAIRLYYGDQSREWGYMDSFLNPGNYMYIYAQLLAMEPWRLIEVGELCDPYNPDREKLIIPVEVLDNCRIKQ